MKLAIVILTSLTAGLVPVYGQDSRSILTIEVSSVVYRVSGTSSRLTERVAIGAGATLAVKAPLSGCDSAATKDGLWNLNLAADDATGATFDVGWQRVSADPGRPGKRHATVSLRPGASLILDYVSEPSCQEVIGVGLEIARPSATEGAFVDFDADLSVKLGSGITSLSRRSARARVGVETAIAFDGVSVPSGSIVGKVSAAVTIDSDQNGRFSGEVKISRSESTPVQWSGSATFDLDTPEGASRTFNVPRRPTDDGQLVIVLTLHAAK